MTMKPANRISEISAEAQHFLQDCMCGLRRLRSTWAYTYSKQTLCRSSKDSLDILLISAKQWLWSACALAQADLSHCLANMWSCRKCFAPISFDVIWTKFSWKYMLKLPPGYEPGRCHSLSTFLFDIARVLGCLRMLHVPLPDVISDDVSRQNRAVPAF